MTLVLLLLRVQQEVTTLRQSSQTLTDQMMQYPSLWHMVQSCLLTVEPYHLADLLFSSKYITKLYRNIFYNISFIYRYGRSREIQTEDLDTTRTLYIQFVFASGIRSCGGQVTTDTTIFLQFSLDQGITWNTLQLVGGSLQSSTGLDNNHIVIPPEAKYPQTRFRIWQPNAIADDYNIWAIDNFLIGGVDMNFPAVAEGFDPIDQNKLVTFTYTYMDIYTIYTNIMQTHSE